MAENYAILLFLVLPGFLPGFKKYLAKKTKKTCFFSSKFHGVRNRPATCNQQPGKLATGDTHN